ncbi:Probable 2-dehydropantoate 2-reductase [Listeria grayi]|uniref:Probable 2-dehydropantoate 2-reductase n=2 Tax=Listeria grayi TaxID=1641 RepID=A0A378MGT0_LISGR|nr:Probable 2-dehydropantoate 2-reductase [Listeria grayi]
MKIGVLGGGALGMLYGGAFSETYPTTIYTRTEEQARKITQNGLLLSIGTKRKKLFPAALVSGKLASSQSIDILFVALKSYQLPAVMPLLRQLPAHIVLCFLSNGIGHLAYLNDLPARTVIVATSEHGAVREQLNQLDWRGMGKTNYSYYRQIREDTVMLDAFLRRRQSLSFRSMPTIYPCYSEN